MITNQRDHGLGHLGLLWLTAVTARLAAAPADRWPAAVPAGIIDTTKIITIRNGAPTPSRTTMCSD